MYFYVIVCLLISSYFYTGSSGMSGIGSSGIPGTGNLGMPVFPKNGNASVNVTNVITIRTKQNIKLFILCISLLSINLNSNWKYWLNNLLYRKC